MSREREGVIGQDRERSRENEQSRLSSSRSRSRIDREPEHEMNLIQKREREDLREEQSASTVHLASPPSSLPQNLKLRTLLDFRRPNLNLQALRSKSGFTSTYIRI